MNWLAFALCGPLLWAISTHLDKYLVERYFRNADVVVLTLFTALDRKSTRLNSSHVSESRMPSSA